jgi:hypothetical protein
MAAAAITPELLTWQELQEQGWNGILIGNGTSRAVWQKFAYGSLLEIAKSNEIEHPLTAADLRVFDELATENFERVMAALATAILVNRSYEVDAQLLATKYGDIRNALVEAVHAVHVPWALVSPEIRVGMRTELLKYNVVYSTNYDLLVYWAVMEGGATGFKDYFWNAGMFSLDNTEVWDKSTVVLYLHGGLHLSKLMTGQTMKRVAGFVNLLDSFGMDEQGATPLFVSEGTSEDKRRSIYNSDYLAFAYNEFVHHKGPLVIFGHSLGAGDGHLISAIRQQSTKRIAISVMPGDEHQIVDAKAHYIGYLPEFELLFFDARTHPLGSPTLRVEAA